MDSNEIVLEIEDAAITCKKEDLIANSDYFKAMLEGNFVERGKRSVKLKGVDLKAMNIILTLLWDEAYIIENEDILLVLQTACMLQFVKIKNLCINTITEMLNPENCVKIWITTEQLDLKPLFLKAKCMALDEFMEIRENECIFELNLDRICSYLGHVNLKTTSELSVFETAMKWWYENENNKQTKENAEKSLKQLIWCVDFSNLTDSDVKEMMTYPDVRAHVDVIDTLKCYLELRSGKSIEYFAEECRKIAQLLTKSKSRMALKFPCILVERVEPENKSKKAKVSSEEEHNVVFYDKFKRKRYYHVLENNEKDIYATVYYDSNLKEFKKLLKINGKKCQSLDGFKLIEYKEFIFMYGGEFLIGKGNWNYNFWAYDTIRDRWERKGVLPFKRRHFETCIVGNYLYIIGGTGEYRVIQENMYWYNYKEDKWSTHIMLPCPGRQLKCCNFLNKLFVFNISNKCGYFFDQNTSIFIKMDICDNATAIVNCSEFSLFSYKTSLFIKGNNLIELKIVDKKLVVVNSKNIVNIVCDKLESVLCNNIVYTLYKHKLEDCDTFSLETYCLDVGDIDYIFQNAPGDSVININGQKYSIMSSLKLFSFHHYNLVEDNKLVNECIFS